MAFAPSIFSVVLSVSLVGYAFDCTPMAEAHQAMKCCKAMQCMSHHRHGQDCCKTMPATRHIGQPVWSNHVLAPIVRGVVQPFSVSPNVTTWAQLIEDQSHAPPIPSTPNAAPLRI